MPISFNHTIVAARDKRARPGHIADQIRARCDEIRRQHHHDLRDGRMTIEHAHAPLQDGTAAQVEKLFGNRGGHAIAAAGRHDDCAHRHGFDLIRRSRLTPLRQCGRA